MWKNLSSCLLPLPACGSGRNNHTFHNIYSGFSNVHKKMTEPGPPGKALRSKKDLRQKPEALKIRSFIKDLCQSDKLDHDHKSAVAASLADLDD
ncbi:MAG: hypothetical protein II189_01360, partial [Lachnospiraceae bacterium]|nr:hypothetical protein [Lachnospiraceae bacterium]